MLSFPPTTVGGNPNLVYIIFGTGYMFGGSPGKNWSLKDILGKALQVFVPVKSYLKKVLIKLFINVIMIIIKEVNILL